MAEYFIRNALNPHKIIKCTITFRQMILKGEEGEPVWLIEIATAEPDKYGNKIAPEYIHYTSEVNLDVAIREATGNISEQVDWSVLVDDTRPPFVTDYGPITAVAALYSNVDATIKDILPSGGIDLTSITMTVNGMDVTDELRIQGSPFLYEVRWSPKIRVKEYE